MPVGTSATIKSLEEEDLSREDVLRQRDEAVQAFLSTLTGAERTTIQVFGEELRRHSDPARSRLPDPAGTLDVLTLQVADQEAVRQALCQLADLPPTTPSQRPRSATACSGT